MVTSYGKPTTIPTLLSAISAQVADSLELDSAQMFVSLEDDKLGDYPSFAQFVQISPRRGTIDQKFEASSGQVLITMEIVVHLYQELGLDVAFSNQEMLNNATSGITESLRAILKSLNQFSPVASAQDEQSIVTEPMRPSGFDFMPRRATNSFAVVRSSHLVSFIMDLT